MYAESVQFAAQGRDSLKTPAEVLAHELARRRTQYWKDIATAATTQPVTTVSTGAAVAGVDLQAYMPLLVIGGAAAAFLFLGKH